MPGTKMPAPYIPDSSHIVLDNAMDMLGKDIIALGGNRTKMLEGLRDYILTIDGEIDIDNIIKEYFKNNGYDFDSEEEDEFEDEEW